MWEGEAEVTEIKECVMVYVLLACLSIERKTKVSQQREREHFNWHFNISPLNNLPGE